MTSVVVVVVVGLLIRAQCVATYTTPTHKVSVALRNTDVCVFVCFFLRVCFLFFCSQTSEEKKFENQRKISKRQKGNREGKNFDVSFFFIFGFFTHQQIVFLPLPDACFVSTRHFFECLDTEEAKFLWGSLL